MNIIMNSFQAIILARLARIPCSITKWTIIRVGLEKVHDVRTIGLLRVIEVLGDNGVLTFAARIIGSWIPYCCLPHVKLCHISLASNSQVRLWGIYTATVREILSVQWMKCILVQWV